MHVSGETVQRLLAITECQASDDAIICLKFEGSKGKPQPFLLDGEPIRLGHLRDLARAFTAWM